MKVFFEKDADCVVLPGYNDETPLHKAVFGGHIETIKLILGYKPNVNARWVSHSVSTGRALSTSAYTYYYKRVLILANFSEVVN